MIDLHQHNVPEFLAFLLTLGFFSGVLWEYLSFTHNYKYAFIGFIALLCGGLAGVLVVSGFIGIFAASLFILRHTIGG